MLASAPAANPVVPPPLSAEDHRERREAQRRMPRKWRAFDRLVADYAAGDGALGRRPPKPRRA